MKKEAASWSLPWTSVTLVLLAIALVGYFFQPSITGALVYRDYGYGGYGSSGGYGGVYSGGDIFGYGSLSASAFYDQYHLYVDAIIFLLIFLGLGKAFLLEHFKSGGTVLYIAVGLALTLGLLLWEEQTGFMIIYNLGPVGILAILVAFYVWIHKATKSHLVAALLVGLLLLYLIYTFPDFYNFFSPVLSVFQENAMFFWLGIAILVFIGIVKALKKS